MSEPLELDIAKFLTDRSDEAYELSQVIGAVDNASDQDKITWLTTDGKRIAAVVPVEVAEYYEQRMTVAVAGRHHRS